MHAWCVPCTADTRGGTNKKGGAAQGHAMVTGVVRGTHARGKWEQAGARGCKASKASKQVAFVSCAGGLPCLHGSPTAAASCAPRSTRPGAGEGTGRVVAVYHMSHGWVLMPWHGAGPGWCIR